MIKTQIYSELGTWQIRRNPWEITKRICKEGEIWSDLTQPPSRGRAGPNLLEDGPPYVA